MIATTIVRLLTNTHAWAEEIHEGAEALRHAGAHEIPWGSIFVQAFNLGFLVVVLFIILRKTVKAHFEHRAREYQQMVSRAEAARTEAEKGRLEAKERLAKLEDSSSQVLERARTEAEELRARMAQEAKAAILRLEQETARTVTAEIERAKADLRRELLDAAIQNSRENLKKNLSNSEQQKLQREFAEKIQVVTG